MTNRCGALVRAVGRFHRRRVTERSGAVLREQENLFALLVLGVFTGLPVPPSPLTCELLPLLEEELIRLLNASHDAPDRLAGMAALLDGF